MCGGKNKKYRRGGNEFRLSCCPVTVWSVYPWSPVKIAFQFMFKVVCLVVVVPTVRLACNGLVLGEEADFKVLNCLPAMNLVRSTKLDLSTEPDSLPNDWYQLA